MTRSGVVALLVAAVGCAACGSDAATPRVRNDAEASAAPAESPPDVVASSSPVSLPKLPPDGIALSGERFALLIDVKGNVLKRLPRFRVAGNPGAPGVWLQRRKDYFRLSVREAQLRPVPRRAARTKMYDEGPAPNLRPPPGARVHGHVAGGWRYAYEFGDHTLAQWSGECEVPTAFWITTDDLRVVTGEKGLATAPESTALGWTSEGEAIVLVGRSACGRSGDPPGLYRFTAPGEGTLIYETKGHVQADMW